MALGAGLRFAVPQIENIKTDQYSANAGAHGYGPRGEHYVAFYNQMSISKAAGNNAWHASVTDATNSVFRGFVADDAGSATGASNFLGQWASSVGPSRLGWVQVGGTVTFQITGAGSASASLANHVFIGSGSGSDHVTSNATAITGNYGLIWAPGTAATTAATAILAGRIFG